jgi:hypothetical protein
MLEFLNDRCLIEDQIDNHLESHKVNFLDGTKNPFNSTHFNSYLENIAN